MSETDIIRFTASISQVRTMADGGLRVVLDFDEINIQAATELMQVKRAGGVVEIAAVAIINPPVVQEAKNDRPNPRHHTPYTKPKTQA
jgi:hypothetical protein